MEHTMMEQDSAQAQSFVRPLGVDDRLAFVHVQKTAGTTLYTVLSRLIPQERISPWLTPQMVTRVAPEQLARYRLVRGHVSYGILARVLPADTIYMTFLREPIERALSHYAHLQRHAPDAPAALGHNMDLEEFVFHPIASLEIANLQTRMIGARLQLRTYRRAVAALQREGQLAHAGKSASADEAIAVLDSMAFVGLTERFDDSLALLTHTFGWPAVREVESTNIGGNKPVRERIPTHVMERIVELNQEDLKLYAHAQRLFATRFATMGQGDSLRATA